MKYLLLLLLFTVKIFGAALDDLQASFMARYDEANVQRDDQLKKLEVSYVGALKRHMDKVKRSGKLELVIPVRDEIEAIETGVEPLPELGEGADRELSDYRDKFLDAQDKVARTHAGLLVDLADKMEKALTSEEEKLTKMGDIDGALAAKRMRETLSLDKGIQSARGVVESTESTPRISSRLGEWRPLLSAEMKVVRSGNHPCGKLSDLVSEKGPSVIGLMAGGTKTDPDTVLVSPSPCLIRFKPGQSVSRIRGKVALVHPKGHVTCRIFLDGEKAFEQILELEERNSEFKLDFDAAKVIELEVDDRGHPGNDRVIWTGLEIR